MTFSATVKNELCQIPVERVCCAVSEAYGALLLGNIFNPDALRIVTAHEAYASRLTPLFRKAFGVSFDERSKLHGKYYFHISDRAKMDIIWETYGYADTQSIALHLNNSLICDDCCLSAFWRGAFLSGGSVTNPQKSYHLEIITPRLPLSRELLASLHECDFEPKQLSRSGVQVLYFKASEAIEDFLTFIGAPVGAVSIMNTKVEKDLRNQVNRKVNCETGNVMKTVEAAARQRLILERLMLSPIWDTLPEALKITARARLDFPEDSLSELAERLGIGRSALNHRLRKLEHLD